MKLFRLAFFNIKKHKAESISLFLLLTLCMTFLASAITGISGIDNIVESVFERTECKHNYAFMEKGDYKEIYEEYFEKDERITEYAITDFIWNESTKYLDENGKEKSMVMLFVTEEQDARIEKLLLESSFSREEIFSTKHFILMPFFAKDTMGLQEGDTFSVLYNEKVYPFTVAGFYETGFFADASSLKCIIGKPDYDLLKKVLGEGKFIGFEATDEDAAEEFIKDFNAYAEDNALGSEAMRLSLVSYGYEKQQVTMTVKLLMELMIVLSVVIFLAIIFMIRFRIKSDIEEQMVAIGVLEALGYKSGEISLSYVLEYLLLSVPAVLVGLLFSFFTAPALLRVGEITTAHRGAELQFGIVPFVLGGILILFVALIGFFRARRIKKLPPVVAFRKGTENHTHKKNRLPLEKTKGSVHLRLAAKGFLANGKTNFGMGLCISVAVVAMMVCFVINDFLKDGVNALAPLTALDISDISMEVAVGTDTAALKKEIEEMPEVRRVALTNTTRDALVKAGESYLGLLVYENYDNVENIKPSRGRCPKHENEIMMNNAAATILKKELGDTITLQVGKIEADYIICGITSNIFVVNVNAYMTAAGYKRLRPSYELSQLDVYLKAGTDTDAFKKKLYESFGAPESVSGEAGSLEEKIRAAAGEKIGVLLEMYGVNHLDYAIQIGDEMITGDSSKFRMKSTMSVLELVDTMLANTTKAFSIGTGIFMVIAVATIMLIEFLIVHSAVRKERNELGVLKGMGYTSNELMLQTAVKIIPVLVVSVIIGCLAGIGIAKLMYAQFGNLPVVVGKVVLMGIAVVLFGFAVAYFSARKIKNISVYELMQE